MTERQAERALAGALANHRMDAQAWNGETADHGVVLHAGWRGRRGRVRGLFVVEDPVVPDLDNTGDGVRTRSTPSIAATPSSKSEFPIQRRLISPRIDSRCGYAPSICRYLEPLPARGLLATRRAAARLGNMARWCSEPPNILRDAAADRHHGQPDFPEGEASSAADSRQPFEDAGIAVLIVHIKQSNGINRGHRSLSTRANISGRVLFTRRCRHRLLMRMRVFVSRFPTFQLLQAGHNGVAECRIPTGTPR